MNRARPAALLLLLAVAACAGHGADSAATTHPVSAAQPAVPVAVAPVRRISVASRTELTGTLSSVESTAVGAVVSGRVTAVAARVGDVVSAGQTLVQIDSSPYQAQLAQASAAVNVASAGIGAAQAQVAAAQSRLVLAQQTAHRMNLLYSESAISAVQHDQSQADLAAARAAVNQYAAAARAARADVAQARSGVGVASVPLGEATVVAPFSGMVTQKMVEAGAVVAPGTPLLQLQSLRDLEVDVAVPDRDAPALGTHTAVTVRVDALGGAVIPAWVRAVVPSDNAALRSVTLKVAVSPRSGLLPGMFARVSLPSVPATHWAVPLQAIVNRAGQTGVFVVSDDTARFVPVTTGATDGRFVAVTGVAGSATRVATSGLELLGNGSRVEQR